MPEQEFPPVPEALLKRLDQAFPELCPNPEWSDRKVWMEVGKREVVRFLKTRFELQVKQALKNNV